MTKRDVVWIGAWALGAFYLALPLLTAPPLEATNTKFTSDQQLAPKSTRIGNCEVQLRWKESQTRDNTGTYLLVPGQMPDMELVVTNNTEQTQPFTTVLAMGNRSEFQPMNYQYRVATPRQVRENEYWRAEVPAMYLEPHETKTIALDLSKVELPGGARGEFRLAGDKRQVIRAAAFAVPGGSDAVAARSTARPMQAAQASAQAAPMRQAAAIRPAPRPAAAAAR